MSAINIVKIRGFKSIRELELNLGKLNVFIGVNGAGKSNILEAIGCLSAAAAGEMSYNAFSWRGMRLSAPEIMRTSLRNYQKPKQFCLEAHSDEWAYSANIFSRPEGVNFSYHSEKLVHNGRFVASRNNKGTKVLGFSIKNSGANESFRLAPTKSILTISDALSNVVSRAIGDDKWNLISAGIESLRSYAIYSLSTPVLRGILTDDSKRTPLGVYGGNMVHALRDLMLRLDKDKYSYFKSLFDKFGWVKSFSSCKPDPRIAPEHTNLGDRVVYFVDSFMQEKFNKIYAYDASEGVLYALFVILLLEHPGAPSLLAIDNIDNALNPGLVYELVRAISKGVDSKNSKQVLLTTHNPTTLDAVDLFNSDHRLFVVERDGVGATNVRRIAPPDGMTREEWSLATGGLRLSQVWLSGALQGALPDGLRSAYVGLGSCDV